MNCFLLDQPVAFAIRFWAFLGELHPSLVHFPIALLITAFALLLLRGLIPSIRSEVISCCLYLGAAGAMLAGLAGWAFADHRYPGAELWSGDAGEMERLLWHRWLGVCTTVYALGASWLRWRQRKLGTAPWKSYLAIAMCAALAGTTGHLGGTLTFGEGFVVEKWKQLWSPAVSGPPAGPRADGDEEKTAVDFTPFEPARALLAERCIKCHGARSSKGGLSLHTAERAFAGGDSGPALTTLDDRLPLLLQRVESANDEDMMPPPDQGGPLSEADRAVLRAWIEAKAPWPEGVVIERKR